MILPNIIAIDPSSETDLGTIIISWPLISGKPSRDVIGLNCLVTSTKTTVNGRNQITITLNEGATNAQVQNFLRTITFATRGKGLKVNTGEIQIQTVDRQGSVSNVVTQNIRVAKKVKHPSGKNY